MTACDTFARGRAECLSLASRRTNLALAGVFLPGRRETQAVVDEKLAEVQEPEGLDPETARILEKLSVAEAWTRFTRVMVPPKALLRLHADAGVSRSHVGRLVGLGARALGEVFSGDELLAKLAAASRAGCAEGLARPTELACEWSWRVRRSRILHEALAAARDGQRSDRVRVEAVFSALAFGALDPEFADSAPVSFRGMLRDVLEKTTTILEAAVGPKNARLLVALTRRPLRRRDLARLERVYGDLALDRGAKRETPVAMPTPSPSSKMSPAPRYELLPAKRDVIARVLGVAPRTLSAWRRRGFPAPLSEGNRKLFDVIAVALWAHENGHVFDVMQLPRDLRDRVERARDLSWLQDREEKRRAREIEQSREAFVAQKHREDAEAVAEAAARRAQARSSA